MELTGANLSAAMQLDVGPGVRVELMEVLSPTLARVRLTAEPGAAVGVRHVLGGYEVGVRSSKLRGLELTFDCRRADITGDGMVDGFDLAALAARFGTEVPAGSEAGSPTDLDGNGVVDGADLALPSPATAAPRARRSI